MRAFGRCAVQFWADERCDLAGVAPHLRRRVLRWPVMDWTPEPSVGALRLDLP